VLKPRVLDDSVLLSIVGMEVLDTYSVVGVLASVVVPKGCQVLTGVL
jgi:hypothetical protein